MNIFWQGLNGISIFILIGCFILCWIYFRKLYNETILLKFTLITLRLITFSSLVILLANPHFKWSENKKITSGINYHPIESRYTNVAQILNEWPFVFHDDMYEIKIVSTKGYDNLEDYILNSKDDITHIIVDDDVRLPQFLRDVNKNEQDYEYLKKIFDSKDMGFNHEMKIFEIEFEKFNSRDT